MKRKFLFNLYYYSYNTVHALSLIYLLLYAFWLKNISIYYTYIMILVLVILLVHNIFNKTPSSLKKTNKQIKNNVNKYTKLTKIMSNIILSMCAIFAVFENELLKSKYYIYCAIIGVIVITFGFTVVILDYFEGKRKGKK